MKSEKQVFATRGGKNILRNLFLKINDKDLYNFSIENLESQYNIRFVFEIDNNLKLDESIFGDKIFEKNLGEFEVDESFNISLEHADKLLSYPLDLKFKYAKYSVSVSAFRDKPINHYSVIDALPIPTEIVTVNIHFSRLALTKTKKNKHVIHKHFDAFSHLGFILADLSKMKNIINNEYGVKKLDLIHEFSNTEIIEKLFEQEIIMIVWGINPYTYPIYSTDQVGAIESLLGKELNSEGIFNIRENLNELSIVPGHELKNWPDFLEKDWPKIKLEGKGKRTYLKPFSIKDSDLETVITSFLIYRDDEILNQAVPLINVDLLYSNDS